jgi:hypothetical protein
MLQALGRVASPGEERFVRMLRAGLREGHWLFASLARVDPDWLVDNAAELVPRRVLGAVLRNLPTHEHRVRLVRALAPWPATEGAQVVEKPFWRTLPCTVEEVATLQAIVAGKG